WSAMSAGCVDRSACNRCRTGRKAATEMNDANRSTRHAGICAAVAGVVTVTVLAGCNGSSDWRPEGFAASVGQTRTAVATQTLDKSLKLAPVGIEFTHFASPTGNIECVITSSDGT